MLREVDAHALAPIEEVVPGVPSHVDVLRPQHLPHAVVLIALLQLLPVLVVLVLQVEDIEGGAAPVGADGDGFLLNFVLLAMVLFLHELPALHIHLVLLHALLLDLIHPCLVLHLSLHLVVAGEISVESVVIREEMRRRGVRVVQQCIVSVLVEVADPVPEALLLESLAVLHPELHTAMNTTLSQLTLSSLVRGSTLL